MLPEDACKKFKYSYGNYEKVNKLRTRRRVVFHLKFADLRTLEPIIMEHEWTKE